MQIVHDVIDWVEEKSFLAAAFAIHLAIVAWIAVLAIKAIGQQAITFEAGSWEAGPALLTSLILGWAILYATTKRIVSGKPQHSPTLGVMGPRALVAAMLVSMCWFFSSWYSINRSGQLAGMLITSLAATYLGRYGFLVRSLKEGIRQSRHEEGSMVARQKVPTKKFADIVGNAAVKARLLAAGSAVLTRSGASSPARNGVLLFGGPGNGKTVFAEALAGELGLPLLQLNYSDVASQWVGEKTARIKQAFDQALRSQPCVLFIDEVDSFLESRTGDRNDGVKEDRDMVNALLTLMVDVRAARVILVAACNHIDRLDAAGIREGRFDFKVEITPPDMPARLGLLRKGLADHLPNASAEASVLEAVARRWNGFSAKRILAVTEELPGYLAGRRQSSITFEDFNVALRAVQGQRGAVPESVKSLRDLVLGDVTREALELIVNRMRDPERTESLGGTLPTGILFYGPPGTGKTATCKALAKTVEWAFLPTTGAELARDPKALDRLYEKAKELRPTLIFIDEADDLLRSREFSAATDSTNKLLTLMDGVADRVHDVVWVAATNHPEQIDSALLRGGRFSEKVQFELPGDQDVARHLAAWFESKKVHLAEGVTPAVIASLLRQQSIANVEAVAQAALNRAIGRRDSPVGVTMKDIESGIRLTLGSQAAM